MIKAIISDFSRVLLSPKDENYLGGLNALHKKLSVGGDYDFWSYFRLNHELLDFYKVLSNKIDIYLFSTEYIQEHSALQPEMDGIFKVVFSGARLGLKKNNTKTYKIIADKVGLKPEETLYIDDMRSNLDVAKEAGMAIVLYKSNDQVIKAINTML